MRIRFDFHAEKLPIIYRHRIMALIKEALTTADPTFKERLYPDKESDLSKVVKPFCFSIGMPAGRTLKREKIRIDEDVEVEETVFHFPKRSRLHLYVSSNSYEFIVLLYNGLVECREKGKVFPITDGINLMFDRALPLNERKIREEEVVFKTVSPILIEDKNEKPVIPSPENQAMFMEEFNSIHDRILREIRGGDGLIRPIEFEPLKINKQVVKHTLRGFREKTGKPYMTLTCFEGCFKLKGDPRDLQMLYQIGIGLRTGQGFGMVEVV